MQGKRTYGGARTALELGFDAPGHQGAVVFLQDYVDYVGIDVFGIDEETVHVEETCTDRRKAMDRAASVGVIGPVRNSVRGTYVGTETICA